MTKAQSGQLRRRARPKKISLVNSLLSSDLNLREIASELNRRMFRQETGKRFNYKSIQALILDEKY